MAECDAVLEICDSIACPEKKRIIIITRAVPASVDTGTKITN